MKQLHYIVLLLALCVATGAQAQKVDLRTLVNPTLRSSVEEIKGHSPNAILRAEGLQKFSKGFCADSMIRRNATGEAEIRFLFTYDAEKRISVLERYKADAGKWEAAQRLTYTYYDDNRIESEILELGINNEWVKKERLTYGDTDDTYTMESWESNAWKENEKQVYTVAADGKSATKKYYKGGVLRSQADYTFDARGELLTEAIQTIDDDETLLSPMGTYKYTYAETGELTLVTYEEPGEEVDWKEEYTYTADDLTKVVTKELSDGEWELESERIYRLAEDGERYLHLETYEYEDGKKVGTTYYKSKYDVDGEEYESTEYVWNTTAADWKEHIQLSSTLTTGGRLQKRTASYWSDASNDWEERITREGFYTTMEDGGERLDRIEQHQWNYLVNKFVLEYAWSYYYEGKSVANEQIQAEEDFKVVVIDKDITIVGSTADVLSVTLCDMGGRIVYQTNSYSINEVIALPSMPKGIYGIVVTDGKKTVRQLIQL